MADQFKAGDTVALKSGGPTMTVAKIDGGRALCEWFEGSKAQSRYFDFVVLKHVDTSGGPVRLERG
jgi:uncharacterized protein YodC (DUF2158 family)